MVDPKERQIWKEIPEYEIEVSSFGNVRNIATGKMIRPAFTGKGYLRVNFKRKCLLIHRLVLHAFVGPCPPKMEVNHINNVTTDNRLANLEYVTSSGNTLHAVKMGTWPVGSKRWNSKLTEESVKEMRRLYDAEGVSIKEIAAKFGANFSAVYHVVRRHNWKHIA